MWDDIYSELVAFGKHVVAATMEPGLVPLSVDDEVIHSKDDDFLERQLDKDVEEDNNDFMHPLDTQSGTYGKKKKTVKGQIPYMETERQSQQKRRRQSPAATLYNEHLASMEEIGKQMLTLMKSNFEASNVGDDTSGNEPSYNNDVEVLERLVDSGLLEGGSEVWCFAMAGLDKPARRRIFVKIKNNDFKVKWLAYEYARDGRA